MDDEIEEIFSNNKKCPFCQMPSVRITRSKTISLLSRLSGLITPANQATIGLEKQHQESLDVSDYAINCTCSSCKRKYKRHPSHISIKRLFINHYDREIIPNISKELKEDFNNVGEIFSGIDWNLPPILCEMEKKSSIMKRPMSSIYHFFFRFPPEDILIVTTDVVVPDGGITSLKPIFIRKMSDEISSEVKLGNITGRIS